MILLTIHLNGSDPQVLLNGLETAASALSKAWDALQAVAPHGRDYYPQGAEAFTFAQREHIERQVALQKVHNDIEALTWHVQASIDAKKQRAL